MAQCSTCTYELPAGAQSCIECGASVEAGKPAAARPKEPVAVDEWLLRGIIRFFIVLVILAAVFTIYSLVHQFLFRGSPY